MADGIPLRVLLVEDSHDDASLLKYELEQGGFVPTLERVETREAMSNALRDADWDIVISDYNLPKFDVLGALETLKESEKLIPFIVISGVINMNDAVNLMRAGAHDFIEKDDTARLVPAIKRELEETETRRKRIEAELALRRSEDRTNLILSSTSEGIFGVDMDGRCIFSNPTCAAELGYDDVNDLLGKQMHALIQHTAEDGSVFAEQDSRILQPLTQGESVYLEEEILCRKDGKRFPAECRSNPIRRDGDIIGAVVSFNDISEKKESIRLLRQAQKMEAVGQLTGGIAHDFNNLLTIILGNIRRATKQPEVTESEDTLALLYDALSAAHDGASLTQHLLTFSRTQSLLPQEFDINITINEFKSFMKRALRGSVEVEFRPEGKDLPAYIDRSLFENAMLNLALNARDAMPDGGTLRVATGLVDIAEAESAAYPEINPGAYIRISFMDEGCGISPENLSKVCDPYFTTKEVGKGSGIGLSMVYGFVSQSGGAIRIESEVGKGTSISLLLPKSVAGQEGMATDTSTTTEPKALGQGQGQRILVVEDEARIRRLAERELEARGYDVTAAENADGAIRVLQETPAFDLVFCDLIMPGSMDGKAFANWLVENYPDVKVLLTTGHAGEISVGGAPENESFPIAHKPYVWDELVVQISNILDGTHTD